MAHPLATDLGEYLGKYISDLLRERRAERLRGDHTRDAVRRRGLASGVIRHVQQQRRWRGAAGVATDADRAG